MIIIRGLNKAFGEKIIFSNFNLEIPDGSFVVISGDSGSGKSTLLNMIGGIEKPDSGSIIIEGLNICLLYTSKIWTSSIIWPACFPSLPHRSWKHWRPSSTVAITVLRCGTSSI